MAIVVTLSVPGVASAKTCDWIGTGTTGDYFVSSNWSCGNVPGSADDVSINGTAGLVVTAGNASITVRTLKIAAGRKLSLTGSRSVSISNNVLALDGTLSIGTGRLTNTGATNSTLVIDTADHATGSGVIQLNGGTLFRQNKYSVSSRITVVGGGNIGNNRAVITNDGTISATAALTIQPVGGSTGISSTSAAGLAGTDNATLYNSGSIVAESANVTAVSGRFQNSATGLFAARNGNTFSMSYNSSAASASELSNLSAAGTLVGGVYEATGSGSTLILRGPTTSPGVVTIGLGATRTAIDTTVVLSGGGSVISAGKSNTSSTATIDSTLAAVGGSGWLRILNGRMFNAGSRALTNNGVIQLGGASAQADGGFIAGSLANGGEVYGHGTISVIINNSVNGSSVRASNGTLATLALTGIGDAIADLGATLSLAAATSDSAVGNLTNNGNIALGARNITVSNDYTNAAFGTGNNFNGRANVTGTGLINALSATQTLSATGLASNTLTLAAIRVGGSTSQTLTITNNGTSTTLRGAIQNGSAPGITIGSPNFVIASGGGKATSLITVAGAVAGVVSQTVNIVNNFANIGPANITVKTNVYAPAVATLASNSVNFGAARVGDSAIVRTVGITNAATGALTDQLVTSLGALPTRVTGSTPGALGQNASGNASFSLGTNVAGIFSGSTSLAFASHNAELADLALASQTINFTGKVYAPAVATLGATSVNFGVVRQGSAAVVRNISVTNTTTGALADTLVTSLGSQPAAVTVTAPGALAAGDAGNAGFTLSTATAGFVLGSTSLGFSSQNPDLPSLTLASQSVNLSGTVTEVAISSLFKAGGTGTLAGSGSSYTLNLGNIAIGSGTVTTDIGVLNAILASGYAETLGGSFSGGTGNGFSFVGADFAGLAAQGSNVANQVTFTSLGLLAGVYRTTLFLDTFSRFPGLSDSPGLRQSIEIEASVFAPFPEPAVWVEMLAGFGFMGVVLRRRRPCRERAA